ncbi:HEAT repeat domain-containing protein [Embleya sp. NPDC020886]|uniref:HEAT repeat domain-containing protein n=1 Tax=Embleya sp. NPDC020886 TaxID=3363980 RepID=UPI0037929098
MDLEILTPLTVQDEHPVMLLGKVFVPQSVRENPPPPELLDLPREVLRRLRDDGQMPDLPNQVDRERLEQARRLYFDRPARPVLEALGHSDRAVVLGDPGAGKSTLARYVVLALAAAELDPDGHWSASTALPVEWRGCLPLLVELRVFADQIWRERTFFDLIEELGKGDHNLGLPKAALERFLHDGGKALIVFDGLDEIFDPGIRADVVKRIEGFASRYSNIRVIVTSRVFGYSPSVLNAAGFTTLMLQDLEPARIRTFATTWYNHSCENDPSAAEQMRARLLRAIDDSPAVAELAGNPMLLTILAIIARRRELPRDRRTVYQHAVNVLIEHWDVNKHLRQEDEGLPHLEPDDKLSVLHKVAHRMQDAPAGLAGNHLSAKELLRELSAFFIDEFSLPEDRADSAARAILRRFQHRNFILSSFGAGLYGFVHRAFLEYLAADDVRQRHTNRDLEDSDLLALFHTHAHDPAWRETLLLLVGMIPNKFAVQVVTRLRSVDPAWRLKSHLPVTQLLALSAVGEIRHRPTLTHLATDTTRLLIDLLTEAAQSQRVFDGGLGIALRQALPASEQAPTWLDTLLYQSWYQVSGYALDRTRTIGRIAAQLYVTTRDHSPATLYGYATSDARLMVRQAAIEAIARRWPQDPETLGLLRKLAITALHVDVRRAAVEEIARRWPGDPETLALLRQLATIDDHQSRRVAVVAIGRGWPGDPETLGLLRDLATTDDHWVPRRAAVEAVARGWPQDSETLALLRRLAATDDHEGVRRSAVEAVARGWPQDSETLALLRQATTDDHEDVREVSVEAIARGWPQDSETLALLRQATTDDHEGVRRSAVAAIARGWPQDSETLALLRQATTDDHEDVRDAAVAAIAWGWRRDPEALALLRRLATTNDHEGVRRSAVAAIARGWPQDSETLALLRRLAATDDHEDVREAAVEAVARGWPENPETLALLRQATTDDHEDVREAAVEAIARGWPENPETLALLRRLATTNDHEDVREAAVEAIARGWPENPETLALLRRLATTDDHQGARRSAVEAIARGWPQDPETLALLRRLATTDDHQGVRRSAVEAIARGWPENPETLALLRRLATTDDHEGVRRSAVDAVARGWPQDPETLGLLRRLATTDKHWVPRRTAVEAIARGWPQDPETLTLLRRLATTDDHQVVRQAAVATIARGWPQDPETLTLLRQLATTDKHWVPRRSAAAEIARGWPQDPETLTLLRQLALTDDHQGVRRVAVELVARRWPRDPETLALLRQVASADDHEDVRQMAATAVMGRRADRYELPSD